MSFNPESVPRSEHGQNVHSLGSTAESEEVHWKEATALDQTEDVRDVEEESGGPFVHLDVRHSLAGIDCDISSLATAWSISAEAGVSIAKNLDQAKLLEIIAPGSVGYLQRELHIEHFGRYPVNLLLEMYNGRNETGSWGILIYAKEDHNDALYDYAALEELAEVLGDHCRIRVVECGSVGEVSNLMDSMTSQYGRAEFAVFCAHGSPEAISLGSSDTGRIDANVVESDLGPLFQRCLKSDAEICLTCCSTGTEDGIGEKLSDASDRTGSAPDASVSLVSFGARISGSHVSFEPLYNGGQSVEFEPSNESISSANGTSES